MRTALLKKLIVYSLSTSVLCLSLFTFALTILPKTTNANHVLCGFNSPVTIQAGTSVTITDISGGVAGDIFRAGIVNTDNSATNATQGTWTKPTLAGVGTITITAPSTAGTYKFVINNDTAGSIPADGGVNLCVTTQAQGNVLQVTAGVPPVGGPVVDPCLPVATFLTFGEVVDKVNRCKIQKTIYDDKATEANIVWGLSDAFYHLLTGKSQIYGKEINGVTAGMGALASSGTMVASLYSHPPVSGMDYLAGEFNKFNPVAPAYAAGEGIGFNALAPVQGIWESFRNIAYIGFVLVFVIIGFMIMFRAHISPQAVATVQDSLPRIVIALFLVTFSYAIAGFMIDAMFLLLNVIINALPGTAESKQFVFKQSVFGAIMDSWGSVFGTVNDAIGKLINNVVDLGFLDKIIGGFGGIVAALVVGIALLFVMFKVFIMLLMSYAYIVILTITAPFFFLAQALPGNNGGSTWFKQMASNIAVFPVVAIMFIFAGILGGVEKLGGSATAAVQSGSVSNFPLLSGDLDTAAIGKLIAIGILLMTPSAAELIKNAIGAKGGPQGAFAPGAAALGASAGFLGRRASESPPAQAFGAMRKYGSERMQEGLINKAPSWVSGKEKGKRLTLGLPTLRNKDE